MAALTNPKASYSAANSTSYIFDQGRSGSSIATIIRTTMTIVISGVNSSLTACLVQMLNVRGPISLSALTP
jgi:hypothetical protein